jgi:ABC-type phosphate/phosphonate transport system substrate-binding protein
LVASLCLAAVTGAALGQATQPSSTQPAAQYDTTLAKPIKGRDWLERISLHRGIDYQLLDKLLDAPTRPPPFSRRPPDSQPAGAMIAEGVPALDDADPFPEPPPLPKKEPTMRLGAALSTYRTREKTEVLSSLQPLIDQVQREVNVRSEAVLYDTPQQIYFGLLDGHEQLAISNVFDYLLVRNWLAGGADNGAIPLAWAQPANPRTPALGRDFPGAPGTSIELIVAKDAAYKTFADLRGARLALAAKYINAPGTYLTQLLAESEQPLDKPFFGKVTLRRYPKDALIDVYKGAADVACVDSGTVAAVFDFYGIGAQLRTLAVSPRYNLDVMYSSANNLKTHKTEIELTQDQVVVLGKNPEGQEVLYLFDTREWHTYREGDFAEAEKHLQYFLTLLSQTPADLKPLLDPSAPVDRRTYDRYGDE